MDSRADVDRLRDCHPVAECVVHDPAAVGWVELREIVDALPSLLDELEALRR